MSIVDHVWGISPGADRVWSQVAGMSPRKAGKRLFLVLQAYIDDSFSVGTGNFVLAGHIATAEAWANLAKEWEELLPYGVRSKSGEMHFKMTEMAMLPERMERVLAFYRIIEKHVSASISCRLNINDVRRAKNRIQIPGVNIDWGFVDNKFMLAYRGLMDMFHTHAYIRKVFPDDLSIDFYFDNQTEKSIVISVWDEYLQNRDSQEIRDLYGATPRFEDDKKFLPLQTADFWAWWVRKWYDEGTPEKMEDCDFGNWKERRKYPRIDLSFDEDSLVANFRSYLWAQQPGLLIYDVKSSAEFS